MRWQNPDLIFVWIVYFVNLQVVFCSWQLPVNIIKSFDPSSFFSSCITDSISFTRLSFIDSRDCKENHYRICWEFQCRICHQPNDPWKFQLRFWTLSFFLLLLPRGRAWPQSIVKVSIFGYEKTRWGFKDSAKRRNLENIIAQEFIECLEWYIRKLPVRKIIWFLQYRWFKWLFGTSNHFFKLWTTI